MSKRLSKVIRNDICREVIKKTSTQAWENLRLRRISLVEKLLDELVTPYAGVMSKMPAGSFPTIKSIMISTSSSWKDQFELTIKDRTAVPFWLSNARLNVSNNDDDRITEKIRLELLQYTKDVAKLKADIETLEGETMVVLNGCTTVKALLSIWPEVEDSIPTYAKDVRNLPAVTTNKVNDLILNMLDE